MGKLNITTKEEWNQFARERNRAAFIHEFGREPHDYEEVRCWAAETLTRIVTLSLKSEEDREKAQQEFMGKSCPLFEVI